jgi:hypothetical protein
MLGADNQPAGTWTFKKPGLGGGGQCNAIMHYADGSKLTWGDVHGGSIRTPTSPVWVEMVTTQAFPNTFYGPTLVNNVNFSGVGTNFGMPVYAAALAPSNTNICYMMVNAVICKCTNVQSNSRTFSQLTGGPYYSPPAGWGTNLRWQQTRMAVSFTDANVMLCGPMEDRVLYCTDGSTINSINIRLSNFTASIATGASATISISGTTMTVNQLNSGAFAIGQVISGGGVASGTTITAGSGSSWTVSVSQTLTSVLVTSHTMTVTSFTSGTPLAINQLVMGAGLSPNNYIKNLGTGTGGTGTYGVSSSTAFASGAMWMHGVQRSTVAVPHLVAFDPTSQKCLYTIEGFGVWESPTGVNGTFSSLAGAPSKPSYAVYDSNGTIWATNFGESSGGNLYKKTAAGSFAKVSTLSAQLGDFEATSFAVHPSNPNIIAGCDVNGGVFISKDGGTTWQGRWGLLKQSLHGGAVAWIGQARGFKLTHGVAVCGGQYQFSIDYTGKVYVAHGFGQFYFDIATVTTTADELVWHADVLGWELMECSNTHYMPNGDLWSSMHDRGPFKITDRNGWSNMNHFGNNMISNECFIPQDTGAPYPNNSCWWIDHVGNTDKIIQATYFFDNGSGQSNDFGKTWTAASGMTDPHTSASIIPHQIVSPQDGELYVIGSNNGATLKSTTGMGGPWTEVTEFTPNVFNGLSQAEFDYSRPMTLDRNTGTIWLFCAGDITGGNRGVWKKPLGAAWTKVYTGYIYSNFGYGSSRMHFVQGSTDTILYTAEFNSPIMMSSGSGGTVWTAIPLTSGCGALGFGKAAPGQTVPSTYFVGKYNNVFGLWVSYDMFATAPKFIVDFPGGTTDNIVWVEGSMTTFGDIALALGHSGILIGTYNHPFTVN